MPQSLRAYPRRGRSVRCGAALCLLAVAGCTPPSQQDIETAQALAELGESFNDIRLTQQELQDQVDSLRGVIARQDSLIRSLANLAGVPVPP